MALKKTEFHTIRFEPSDYQWLEKRAGDFGVSVGRYIREVALCERSQDGQEIGRGKELEAIKSQLLGIGNNLNQVAKVANGTGQINEKRLSEIGERVMDTTMLVMDKLR